MTHFLSLLLLGGLAHAADPAPTEGTTPLAAEMQNHWTVATGARDAVIHGDLAGAHVIARGLATRPAPEALPDPWRPLYAEMQAAADKIAVSDSIEAAAAAVGTLGLTCAECHDFTGGGPKKLVLPMPPPKLPEGASDMPLHLWAVDWLWVGLVSKDAESWKRGAEALEHAPFAERPNAPRSDVGLTAMEHLAHLLPSTAMGDDRALMAQRFGETITACALCHGEVSDAGLKQPPGPAPKPAPAKEAK